MSLKTFHIFFIAVSVLFSIGFGIWLLLMNPNQESTNLLFAVISFLIGIGLIVYGIRFLRKLKDVSYL